MVLSGAFGAPVFRFSSVLFRLWPGRSHGATRHLYCLHICNHRILEFAQCLKGQDTNASRRLNCLHN